jgi:hypothetical protein
LLFTSRDLDLAYYLSADPDSNADPNPRGFMLMRISFQALKSQKVEFYMKNIVGNSSKKIPKFAWGALWMVLQYDWKLVCRGDELF